VAVRRHAQPGAPESVFIVQPYPGHR
jgi:hypothetical protein